VDVQFVGCRLFVSRNTTWRGVAPCPQQHVNNILCFIHFNNSNGKVIWYLLHRLGSRHCHLVIGHCTIRQCLILDNYLSCKICFNVLNCVFSLFIYNLYCLANIQQHCHNSSHCDWQHHQRCREIIYHRSATVVPCQTARIATCLPQDMDSKYQPALVTVIARWAPAHEKLWFCAMMLSFCFFFVRPSSPVVCFFLIQSDKNAISQKLSNLELCEPLTTNRSLTWAFQRTHFGPLRQQTSPRAPQRTPVKNFTLVKWNLC